MRRIAVCLLATLTLAGMGQAQTPPMVPADTSTAVNAPVDVELGGMMILRVRAAAGGQSPQERADVLTGRLTNLLGFPGIVPADVAVYVPKGQPPAIYALGRRVLTVDAAAVTAMGGGDPLALAARWAKRLQQVLPRVNYRPSNMPEPVIPPNPPLTVTDNFEQVGGGLGTVTLRGKDVFRVIGPQPGGLTAVERADALTARLARLANTGALSASGPPIAIVPEPIVLVRADAAPVKTRRKASPVKTAPAQFAYRLQQAATRLLVVTPDDAKRAGAASAQQLAQRWAKSIQAALAPVPQSAPATSAPAVSAPALPPLALPPAPLPPPPAPVIAPAS